MKLNYPMIIASVIAGVVVLLISEFAFKRTVENGAITTKLAFGQD